jgi:hypothetical protein
MVVAGVDPGSGGLVLVRTTEPYLYASEPYLGEGMIQNEVTNDFSIHRGSAIGTLGDVHLWYETGSTGGMMHASYSGPGASAVVAEAYLDQPWMVVFDGESEGIGLLEDESSAGQLVAQTSGGTVLVDDLGQQLRLIRPAAEAVTAAGHPAYHVLAASDAAIKVAAEPASGLEPLALPIALPGVLPCDHTECSSPACTYVGEYVMPASLDLARTSDGRLWATWTEVHEDTESHYPVVSDGDAVICGQSHSRNDSTAQLVLAQIDLEAGTSTEVLRLDVPGVAPTSLVAYLNQVGTLLTAVEDQLSLSMTHVSEAELGPLEWRKSFRALRVDTTLIP